jgi:hypothetical protein
MVGRNTERNNKIKIVIDDDDNDDDDYSDCLKTIKLTLKWLLCEQSIHLCITKTAHIAKI